MEFTHSHKGSHDYVGKVNGKTYVVRHHKLNIYEPHYKEKIPHHVVTSREHIVKHNPNLTHDEITKVHDHIKSIHEEVDMSTQLNEDDNKKFWAGYKRNESQNKHTLNAHNMAHRYGDEADKALAKKGVDALKKHGHQPHGRELDTMHVRLLAKAREMGHLKEEVDTMLEENEARSILKLSEETGVEQIDELSKELIQRYLDKVRKSSKVHGDAAHEYLMMGFKKKLSDQELAAHKTSLRKVRNNVRGMGSAIRVLLRRPKPMIKETSEQLDELNKSTLHSYVGKAAQALKKHSEDTGRWSMGASNAKIHGDPHVEDAFRGTEKLSRQKAQKRLKGITKASGKLMKEEVNRDVVLGVVKGVIAESVSRKHFQQVADVIKSHPDAAKRKELAHHHSEIFAKQNPRFDRKRFFAAAGADHDK